MRYPFVLLVILLSALALAAPKPKPASDLWVLKPVAQIQVPSDSSSSNPIDAFIAAQYRAKGLTPAPQADKLTLLRRVYLDMIGLPPTPKEQQDFLADTSADAYEKVVDRLLASEQYGVRYGRHWLDVLRYADVDEQMIAAPGIYLWRDWVIRALNEDVPYDQFVRAQLTGYRSTVRTKMSATGYRSRAEPRMDDMFALGFLARNQVLRDGKDNGELAIQAVDTISTAFMGLTVGCAKCHDHMFDPITQRDYYSLKALFDSLTLRKVTMATPQQIIEAGKSQDEIEQKRGPIEAQLEELIGPYRKRLYDDRVAMLPPDVQAIILKPQKQRSPAEQKIADDYFPVLRIDSDKIMEVMPPSEREKYSQLQRQLDQLNARPGGNLPVFYTVQVDPLKEQQQSYILTSADVDRPEKNHPVNPGWPFAPANIDWSEGRIEAFSDWLTAPQNPMFARVCVNRLWQWHFGQGLQKLSSDFGSLGGTPTDPQLLDWLAGEFVRRGFSMKQMHRLMVTSNTYKMASDVDPQLAEADTKIDPNDDLLWHFRLERLEAEPIWDSILYASGDLDLSVGGPSFNIGSTQGRRGGGRRFTVSDSRVNRRAAYMIRGYSTSGDVVPAFLQAFDVDDGRTPCPMRTQTVTAPQALFAMNSPQIDRACEKFAARIKSEAGDDLRADVRKAYEVALGREPSQTELDRATSYIDNDPARLKNFAWLLFNLDEFIYVR